MTLEEEIYLELESQAIEDSKNSFYKNVPNRIFNFQYVLHHPRDHSSVNIVEEVEEIVYRVAKKYDKAIRLTSPLKMVRELEIND